MEHPPDGYGVNCSYIEESIKVIKKMSKITEKPLVPYPNDMHESEEGFVATQGYRHIPKYTEKNAYVKKAS